VNLPRAAVTNRASESEKARPIRVIVAKAGLDSHERGAYVVVLGLRDLGFEVMYLGLRRSPDEIVQAVVQEDVDVLGISSMSGGHRRFVLKVLQMLRELGVRPVVILGGVITEEDRQPLLDAGLDRIFGQGTLVSDIATYLRSAVGERDAGE
jgi:methylmalonyl-CoA mutase, C-terminal domain